MGKANWSAAPKSTHEVVTAMRNGAAAPEDGDDRCQWGRPSENGRRRVVLYARVSTEEQARSGFSLAQQLEALREYAERAGYEVVEEVSDPGYSGASLARPGIDRVRRLVAAGAASMVLAQDRDRISREPAYGYLLRREFEERGGRLVALNDRGDGSPEGHLMEEMLDLFSKTTDV